MTDDIPNALNAFFKALKDDKCDEIPRQKDETVITYELTRIRKLLEEILDELKGIR